MAAQTLIACPECDQLQHEIALAPHAIALCSRCGAQLYRQTLHGLDYTLAFTLASVLFFLLANVFPLLRLELQGSSRSTTLFGAVTALASQELISVALLVLATTILVPALEMAAMLYILVPLKLGANVPGVAATFRFVQMIRPWGMVEVFMLGLLVSVVKLATSATVIPGVALWSFGALMFTLSAAAHFFNPRDLWLGLRPYG
ncbi:paraquat-inducible protein A [Actimicrobium antarcticum]|uniref:Paraquat-inducible protein A n=1 Tax=Actimicrobium antarcticum TaxID=1051899 RepID=A0ABP7STP5_9BURK